MNKRRNFWELQQRLASEQNRVSRGVPRLTTVAPPVTLSTVPPAHAIDDGANENPTVPESTYSQVNIQGSLSVTALSAEPSTAIAASQRATTPASAMLSPIATGSGLTAAARQLDSTAVVTPVLSVFSASPAGRLRILPPHYIGGDNRNTFSDCMGLAPTSGGGVFSGSVGVSDTTTSHHGRPSWWGCAPCRHRDGNTNCAPRNSPR